MVLITMVFLGFINQLISSTGPHILTTNRHHVLVVSTHPQPISQLGTSSHGWNINEGYANDIENLENHVINHLIYDM